MEKVYCEKCIHCKYHKDYGGYLCWKNTVDNWYSPTTPFDVTCAGKNENNDCQDFKEKDKS